MHRIQMLRELCIFSVGLYNPMESQLTEFDPLLVI